MRTLLTFALVVLIPIVLIAQDSKKKKKKSSEVTQENTIVTSTAETMYKQAMQYGDYEAARAALYYMMAEQPENYHLKDSLAKIYLGQGYYHLANIMADEVLNFEPENQSIMEVKAISLQAMGKLEESAAIYKQLFAKGKSLQHGYQLAVIQYNLKNFGACKETADIIIAMENSKTETIYLNYGENTGQEVSLKAASHNLKGVMHKELQQLITAKNEFEAAIAAYPGFDLAQKNLESLPPAKAPMGN